MVDRRIFVSCRAERIRVVDFAQRKEVARIRFRTSPRVRQARDAPIHPPMHKRRPDNKTLWVTSVFANAVFVYSLPELKLLGHVALPELKLPGALRSAPCRTGRLHARRQASLRHQLRDQVGVRDRYEAMKVVAISRWARCPSASTRWAALGRGYIMRAGLLALMVAVAPTCRRLRHPRSLPIRVLQTRVEPSS